MSDLQEWLTSRGLDNPHSIPDEHKEEYKALFGHLNIIWPQPGGQITFSNCTADIAFYGGEAGAGKSFILSFEHMKWQGMGTYAGALVRKTNPQIFKPGGLWSNAAPVFRSFGGKPVRTPQPLWYFPSGGKVYFMHSQHAKNVEEYWQGIEVPYIGVDEVTQFERDEFLYITSRLRSMTGIDAYLRATCNPDPNSWVREFIDWWVDKDGYIINERCGVIRYYVFREERFVWADDPQELIDIYGPKTKPMSFTFIRGHLKDNKMLLEKDPTYEAKLQNLSASQVRALCEGNWNHYDDPNALFKHSIINAHRVPTADFSGAKKTIISIDPCGSTSKQSDECGIIAGFLHENGHVYITNDVTGNYLPNDWAEHSIRLYDTLEANEVLCEANYGGQMVKNTIEMYAKSHDRNDINVKVTHSRKSKYLRAEPVSVLYEKGMVHHVGNGLGKLEKEMCSFKEDQEKSPNRLDAVVFLVTRLLIDNAKRMPRLVGVIQ